MNPDLKPTAGPRPTSVSHEGSSAPSWSRRSLVRPGLALAFALAGLLLTGGLVGRWWWRHRDPARATGPAGHWAAVYRGRSWLDQGRPDLALEAVAGVRDEAPGAGEAMAVAGVALARMEALRDARLALERALKLQPRQPLATRTLAAVYLGLGESDRGLACLKSAAALVPRDPRPWVAMGRVYLDLGEPDQARGVYSEALKRDPTNVEAQVGSIEALITLNRLDEAETALAAALPRIPDNPRLLGLAARQARESGRNDDARALADQALARDPDQTDALLTRARVQHAAGHSEAARGDLERLVALNPNHLAALNLLAQVETRLGDPARAADAALRRARASDRLARMDALTREMTARPDDPEPRYQMGLVALDGRQATLAASCFQAALALDPTHAGALAGLARLRRTSKSAAITDSPPASASSPPE